MEELKRLTVEGKMYKDFSIQCPSCLEWTNFRLPLENIAFKDEAYLKKCLNDLKKSSPSIMVLRCKHQNEPWICPAPFEAVIYEGKNPLNRGEICVPDSWMGVYTFRLRELDQCTPIPDYHVVLFCTQSVERLPTVELEQLLNFDLLSKSTHGICAQVKSPVTIYAAKVLGEDRLPLKLTVHSAWQGGVCWLPVETYDEDETYNERNPLLPERYNPYCAAKRKIFFKHMIEIASIGKWAEESGSCPLKIGVGDGNNRRCGMTKAACQRKDWNLCPAFSTERWEFDNCYSSDLEKIGEIRENWNKKGLASIGIYEYDCETGFHERAIPIIVHNHLVGVAFCGQVFDDKTIESLVPKRDLHFLNKYIEEQEQIRNNPDLPLSGKGISVTTSDIANRINTAKETLDNGLKQLEQAKSQLLDSKNKERFNISDEQLNLKAELLQENVEEIQKLANTRYLHLRARTEDFFRKEILQKIRRESQDWHHKKFIPCILERMRKFWLFEVGIIIPFVYSNQKGPSFELPFVSSSQNPQISQKDITGLSTIYGNKNIIQDLFNFSTPFHYLYEPGVKEVLPSLEKKLIEIIKDLKVKIGEEQYTLEDSKKKFIVCVPFYNQIIWLFVFIERDITVMSPLKSECNLLSISPICQESIRETCIEVAHEFFKADMASLLKRLKQKAQQQIQEQQKKPSVTNNVVGNINTPHSP